MKIRIVSGGHRTRRKRISTTERRRNQQIAKLRSDLVFRDYTEEDRAKLKQRIETMLPDIEARTGLHCNGWTVRKMRTRWGSCNTKTHHINLSLLLARQTDEQLEYVIVHELVHTKVPNHGPEFKAMLDDLMPRWRQIRGSMNAENS